MVAPYSLLPNLWYFIPILLNRKMLLLKIGQNALTTLLHSTDEEVQRVLGIMKKNGIPCCHTLKKVWNSSTLYYRGGRFLSGIAHCLGIPAPSIIGGGRFLSGIAQCLGIPAPSIIGGGRFFLSGIARCLVMDNLIWRHRCDVREEFPLGPLVSLVLDQCFVVVLLTFTFTNGVHCKSPWVFLALN